MNHTIATWEAAYLRFETPDDEIRKFRARLRKFGAAHWPRDADVVELFCGRGGGLRALEQLGLTRLEGVDISAALLAEYSGPARMHQADCRHLPFNNRSKDVIIVQGGLHHLGRMPEDLDLVLSEARRVLRPGGRFVCIEPWLTPFLRVVHAVSRNRLARRLWSKLDNLETMIENERPTYEQWLANGPAILRSLEKQFTRIHCSIGWGKLTYVGRR